MITFLVTRLGLSTLGAKMLLALATLLAMVFLVGGAYLMGHQHANSAWETKMATYIAKVETAEKEAEMMSERLNQKNKDEVRRLQELLDAANKKAAEVRVVIKEVPKYVTREADARCVIPAGFVWLHNLPLEPESPGVSGSKPPDVDAPTEVKLSEVAAVAADNNVECVQRGQVIDAWQEWYRNSADAWQSYRENLPPPVEIPR